MCRCDSEHRFWKPCEVDAEVESASVSEALRSCRITFAGQFEPVQHRCRAPRPDGQLCARQDRLKVGLGWAPACWLQDPLGGHRAGPLHLGPCIPAHVVLSLLCAGPRVQGDGLTADCPPCLAPSRCT